MNTPHPEKVSFSVNTCNSDAPYLEQTLRHMMRQLDFPFFERRATYDPGRQEGKYAERIDRLHPQSMGRIRP
jgi:hypothetical protein